jgi:hypothetical protein
MIDPDTSLIEGAFAVCTALDAAGFTAVLCGGSAATFYAPDAYMSADNDFVLTVELSRREISAIIAPLGFREQGRIYVHDAVGWSVDFPRGPLAIGREVVTKWSTERRNDQVLHVITATDSVRDRFMHYWAGTTTPGSFRQSLSRRRSRITSTAMRFVRGPRPKSKRHQSTTGTPSIRSSRLWMRTRHQRAPTELNATRRRGV